MPTAVASPTEAVQYFYCPNPNCRRKLFYGTIDQLVGYLNFRCHRCHTECTLGANPARLQVFPSASPERPPRQTVAPPA